MTERLSDERLKRLREAYSLRSGLSAFEAERECSKDAVSAIDELLALRAKLSAGPVMPETPSEFIRSKHHREVHKSMKPLLSLVVATE